MAQSKATCNIAAYLPRMAATVPDQAAVVITRSRDASGKAIYTTLNFTELEALSNRYANGLASAGFQRGQRVLLMVRPGLEFTGLVFALFKLGVVPVMIDPGMGVSRMLECIRQVDLQGFIGIPIAHAIRVLRPKSFKAVTHIVTVGKRWFWGGPTLESLSRGASDRFNPTDTDANETAAILFTSGSTGPAKGVVYEHGMFGAQVKAIQSAYNIEPGEIDLPAFPLFALFSTAMGMTCVIPDMNPSCPANVDPQNIVEAILDHKVTNTFGSPAIWNKVATYCVQHGIQLPSLKRILIAGAPVSYTVIEKLHKVLISSADVHTPYGATESLPISTISGREILDECRQESRHGAGTCVGKPLPHTQVRFIKISDDPIKEWSDDLCVPDGEVGEIVVSGTVVTRQYYGQDRATAYAKIRDGDRIWHRVGDLGYRDDQGRIWFCGRKSHRVTIAAGMMCSVRCEGIFNEHGDVFRSALVGIGPGGSQRPVIIIEPVSGKFPRGSQTAIFRNELLELGRANTLTHTISDVLFHQRLPVDIRHNAKINREQLATWAAERLR